MGKSVSTPKVPDYTAAAKEQGVQNKDAALQSSILSNPNMVTPYGTQTVSYSQPTFNEAGYNSALNDYNAKKSSVDRNNFYTGSYGGDGNSTFDQAKYDAALSSVGSAPDRASFNTGGGVPTVTQTLTPEAQSTLESQQRVQRALAGLGEVGVQNATNLLSTPFTPTSTAIQKDFGGYGAVPLASDYLAKTGIDTSNIAAMPINAGMKAQDLIMQRLNPTIEQGDTSFKQALANQGLAPGTTAYDAAYRNRANQVNDLYNQAALQGINLDMSANQQGYNQALQNAGLYNSAVGQNYGQGMQTQGTQFSQGLNKAQFQNTAQQQQLAQDMALRSQPLNEIIGLMGGSQLQLPQFSGYQGTSVAPAPIYNATQQQYQGALGQANAQNAANNSMTQGLFSLGGAALMAPTGTFPKMFGG